MPETGSISVVMLFSSQWGKGGDVLNHEWGGKDGVPA